MCKCLRPSEEFLRPYKHLWSYFGGNVSSGPRRTSNVLFSDESEIFFSLGLKFSNTEEKNLNFLKSLEFFNTFKILFWGFYFNGTRIYIQINKYLISTKQRALNLYSKKVSFFKWNYRNNYTFQLYSDCLVRKIPQKHVKKSTIFIRFGL